MKVVIAGANSAVGQAILRRARRDETAGLYVAAVRSIRAEEQIRRKFGNLGAIVRVSFDDPASLDAAFRGATAVIHLSGVLIEQRDSTYEQANVESTRSVIQSATRNMVEKVVLVSARRVRRKNWCEIPGSRTR
jgi:nucleoside-diphosphate-sugar epimerase